jgi:hypothetical protein
MKTMYIQWTTKDPDEDMEVVEKEMDLFIDRRIEVSGWLRLAVLWDSPQ